MRVRQRTSLPQQLATLRATAQQSPEEPVFDFRKLQGSAGTMQQHRSGVPPLCWDLEQDGEFSRRRTQRVWPEVVLPDFIIQTSEALAAALHAHDARRKRYVCRHQKAIPSLHSLVRSGRPGRCSWRIVYSGLRSSILAAQSAPIPLASRQFCSSTYSSRATYQCSRQQHPTLQ